MTRERRSHSATLVNAAKQPEHNRGHRNQASRAGVPSCTPKLVPHPGPFTSTTGKRVKHRPTQPRAFRGRGRPPQRECGADVSLCLGALRRRAVTWAWKSSLTIQFVEGQFVDSYDPTIENTFTKLITVNGQEYHLQLVDTAGQDEYSIFPQTYSIDINGYILVYSVTSIKSFEVIKVIHGKLLDMVGKVQIPIMLVGNKKDLHMERVISYEEGKALAESWNAAFLESSAKENQTAVDVFRRIILEAEKIDGAASQGKSSCLVM
ncbi:GTP-binding protein Rheb [Neophocaena asiaeorientalis asiaeorientalis]|uniref:GTP-binding protein Rheb n=1 Tax=Neophocaena asiaeorientalis asiaeorientalis TaxID=1706337 RepID=A0A341C5Z8_NEOAA|nr:GTP-binding protein Rheb [Neophocaena asiaeorientalis asiaeorientalis]